MGLEILLLVATVCFLGARSSPQNIFGGARVPWRGAVKGARQGDLVLPWRGTIEDAEWDDLAASWREGARQGDIAAPWRDIQDGLRQGNVVAPWRDVQEGSRQGDKVEPWKDVQEGSRQGDKVEPWKDVQDDTTNIASGAVKLFEGVAKELFKPSNKDNTLKYAVKLYGGCYLKVCSMYILTFDDKDECKARKKNACEELEKYSLLELLSYQTAKLGLNVGNKVINMI